MPRERPRPTAVRFGSGLGSRLGSDHPRLRSPPIRVGSCTDPATELAPDRTFSIMGPSRALGDPMSEVQIRAAGIWIESNRILLESLTDSDIWGIPGGSIEGHELASEACRREYQEELGIDVRCRSLAIIHEALYRKDGRVVREHGFYFHVEPSRDMPTAVYKVESRESQLKFRWFPLEHLHQIEFVPDAVRRVLPLIGSSPIFVSERTAPGALPESWSAQALAFSQVNHEQARAVLAWRYDPPYDVYNPDPDQIGADIELLLDPSNRYHAIADPDGELIAYCCYGRDGQVPGGDYSLDALDIGLGVRPDLTGRGSGAHIVRAVLEFADRNFPAPLYRVTVAAFNERALRVWEHAGFRRIESFRRSQDGMPFFVLARPAGNAPPLAE